MLMHAFLSVSLRTHFFHDQILFSMTLDLKLQKERQLRLLARPVLTVRSVLSFACAPCLYSFLYVVDVIGEQEAQIEPITLPEGQRRKS